MLYAASLATVKRDLGDSHFSDEVFGTTFADFTLDALQRHQSGQTAGGPLTQREMEALRVRQEEVKSLTCELFVSIA